MLKTKKKTKKKIFINGETKKVDYDVFMLIRHQDEMLKTHESALLRFVRMCLEKDKRTEEEEIIYQYCMQINSIVHTLEYLKNNENEKEINS